MPDDVLKNVMAVVGWLNDHGYEIKKSAVYQHRKEGKLISDDRGRFPVSSVKRYADNWLTPRPAVGFSADVIDLQEKKLNAEARKLQAQAEHWELKTRIQSGEYVERDAFERELAARAVIFKSDMENFIRGRGADLVDIVDGDAGKLPDLIDFYLDQLEIWLSRYSETDAVFGEPKETDKEENQEAN